MNSPGELAAARANLDERNASELTLYTTDQLRSLYQNEPADLIRLRDGIISRTELVAEIHHRDALVSRGRRADRIYAVVSAVGAALSMAGAVLGWIKHL